MEGGLLKKKYLIITFGILLLALLICALLYTRPMTLAQLCSGVDVIESESVHGYYFIAPGVEDTYFEIDKDDERFSQMIDSFATRAFRKSLANLFPLGSKTHFTQDGDFKWEVIFKINDVTFPDGSNNSGDLIRVSNFFGLLEVHFNGDVWRCATNDSEEWVEDVMALISDQ